MVRCMVYDFRLDFLISVDGGVANNGEKIASGEGGGGIAGWSPTIPRQVTTFLKPEAWGA